MLGLVIMRILVVCSVLLPAVFGASTLEEERLLNYLSDVGSHPMARPVKRVEDAVEVNFRMTLLSLEIDEKAETMYSHVWFSYVWHSPYLTWNPANYSDIKSVRIPLKNIWDPDLAIYNSKGNAVHQESKVVLWNDGTLHYMPYVRTASICDLDLTYFPYDTQQCFIKIGSWTFSGSKLNLTGGTLDLSGYTPNKAWKMLKGEGKRNVRSYGSIDRTYINVQFTFSLQRASSYFTYVYVGPVVVLSLLGAAIFILPPSNPQKTTLGGALLICYSLFFLDMSYVLPPVHASTPLVDKYYMAMFFMLAISVCLAAISTNLAKRAWTHSHPPDLVTKVILGGLGRVLCVSPRNQDTFGSGAGDLSGVKPEDGSQTHSSQTLEIHEWYDIATVMDRLFLALYMILTVLLTFSILVSYPKP